MFCNRRYLQLQSSAKVLKRWLNVSPLNRKQINNYVSPSKHNEDNHRSICPSYKSKSAGPILFLLTCLVSFAVTDLFLPPTFLLVCIPLVVFLVLYCCICYLELLYLLYYIVAFAAPASISISMHSRVVGLSVLN